jgi:hypothetical protein
LREERRLRVFENRALKRVFAPERDEVVKSRRMRWAGHMAHMEEDRCVHRVLVGKPEGKRTFGETKT